MYSPARSCLFATAALVGLAGGLRGADVVVRVPAAGKPATTPAQKEAESKGSHRQVASIAVQGSDGSRLQTLCVDDQGRVLALAAPPRSYGAATSKASGEVLVFQADGKPLTRWKVGFHAQAINVGPDGSVFVAGDGRVARFDRTGKARGEVELPHLKEAVANKEAMRREAEAELKQRQTAIQQSLATFTKMKEKLEAIPAEKRTALQKNQLLQYERILASYKANGPGGNQSIESVLTAKLARLRVLNGLALSDKDVFVVCGEAKGYGYAVWRMSHDFTNPVRVLTGLSGCCGQMDVQCCEGDLLVAENTRHRFARYDRDGKLIGAWGKRDTGGAADGFGGCCNPMNLRACKGEVYTAESEGLIKRFSGKGEFAGVVGYAPLTGGCKNVAVAVSPDASRVYFADQPGSRIIVLARKEASK